MNTNLIEIFYNMDQTKKWTKKENQIEDKWTPETIEDYIVPPFNIPTVEKRNEARQKKQLQKVLSFISKQQHNRVKDGATIIPIPTHDKKNIQICGSAKGVSRLIDFMLSIGLITTYSDYYHFDSINSNKSKSRLYVYYYTNEQKILEYCDNNNINNIILVNYDGKENIENMDKYNPLCDAEDLCDRIGFFDSDEGVKISAKRFLKRPANWSKEYFRNYILKTLYHNYPDIPYYQRLADSINHDYYNGMPELSIAYIPTISYERNDCGDNAVKKISIRATNASVNATKDNNAVDKQTRQQVMDRYGLFLNYDVSSSVYRLTLSLNSGKWISEEECGDIYEQIFIAYRALHDATEGITELEYDKKAMKSMCMYVYFNEGSEDECKRNVCGHLVEKMNSEDVKRELNLLKEAMEMVIGPFYYSDIFRIESEVYMDVLAELFHRGYFVWQVYDAFYAKPRLKKNMQKTNEDFELLCKQLIETKFNEYYTKWIKKEI